MSKLCNPAKDAKAMLGPTGELRRVAALATVSQNGATWLVGATDSCGNGRFYGVAFTGPEAQARALEYASEKYSGYRLTNSE
jgi:hypothetical protein